MEQSTHKIISCFLENEKLTMNYKSLDSGNIILDLFFFKKMLFNQIVQGNIVVVDCYILLSFITENRNIIGQTRS